MTGLPWWKSDGSIVVAKSCLGNHFMLVRNACLSIALLSAWGMAVAGTEAPIRSVVLYPGTALVHREVSVVPGSRRIEIEGLPTDFAVDSLRVEGSEGIQIGQLSVKDQATTARPDPREAELEDRIQSLKDKEAMLDIDAQAAGTVRDVLGRLSLGSDKDGPALVLTGHGLADILEQVRKSSTESLATIQKVDQQKRELDRQIDAGNQDLEKLRSGRTGQRVLSFDIAAVHAGKVLISYPLRGAGWRPAYRAELDSASGKVSLRLQAIVHQKTGEDWHDISLRLSTGRPQLAVSGPQAAAWELRLQPEYRQPQAFSMAAPAPAPPPMFAMSGARAAAPPAEVEEFQAPFTTEFNVPLPVSLASDGTETTLALSDHQLDASVRDRIVPRIEATAYVEAEAPRPQGDWLPGSVQLLRDGDYVGQSFWQPQREDKLLLPFGRDDLVHVAYQRMQDRSGTAGLLGKRGSREINEVYTISSSHRGSVALLVLDPTPVSTDDEIKVDKDFTPVPDVQDWDSRKGVVAWRPTLKPGESTTFKTHYTLSYPEGRTVLGLL